MSDFTRNGLYRLGLAPLAWWVAITRCQAHDKQSRSKCGVVERVESWLQAAFPFFNFNWMPPPKIKSRKITAFPRFYKKKEEGVSNPQ